MTEFPHDSIIEDAPASEETASAFSYDSIVNHTREDDNGPITHTQLKSYLRHKHPMLGVDQVLAHNFKSGWMHAVRAVSCSHPAFEGHFEDAGIYPGTNMMQDTIQLGIAMFLGTTRPLKGDGNSQEMTVVSDVNIKLGHPVPPGTLLDIAVWRTGGRGIHSIKFDFELRVRDFPYYETKNDLGITFSPAMEGSAELNRVKRRIYAGIGF